MRSFFNSRQGDFKVMSVKKFCPCSSTPSSLNLIASMFTYLLVPRGLWGEFMEEMKVFYSLYSATSQP